MAKIKVKEVKARSFSDHVKSLEGDRKLHVIGMHISNGNSKVPFYIFNMNSATDCPSLHDERCQAGSSCYALKAEIRYHSTVLPYRRRQEIIWKHSTVGELASAIIKHHSQRKKEAKKVFRFSESGDFRSQRDVKKMTLISEILIADGWDVYGYTSRTDLDLGDIIAAGVHINVSNREGNWTGLGANEFRMVFKESGDNFVCVGDCSKCSVCRKVRGKVIEVVKH